MGASYVAMLRAVNVGGTGKLPMAELTALCEAAGFGQVRTYIASGNVAFHADGTEDDIRSALQDRLHAHMRRAVGVIVRSAADMAEVVTSNPFPDRPGNRVMALFLDGDARDPLVGVTGLANEQLRPGRRVLYVWYPDGMAMTRLRIPAAKTGTARNMNTVGRLAAMAAAIR